MLLPPVSSLRRQALFLLFFLSGFCSLLYQVVWIRMAFASFGIISPVLSVVLSVFMAGLAIGSAAAGKWAVPLATRLGVSAIVLYAVVEALIGVGAFAVPKLFAVGESLLLPVGETDSTHYLISSALVLALAILPWCVFMGATFPIMMAHVRERDPGETTSFSFLYLGNVIGALTGVGVTAVVLIESLGFSGTLLVAGLTNFAIAGIALAMTRRVTAAPAARPAAVAPAPALVRSSATVRAKTLLFTTGFVAMAMEVVWVRAFTPVLMSQVYSFAALLFVYLLATSVGSWLYRLHVRRGRVWSVYTIVAWMTVLALLPVILNDARAGHHPKLVLASIFPFCAFLGYLTPGLVDDYARGRPEAAGRAYAINVIGCILGPLFASYVLLPYLGARFSAAALAVPFAILLIADARRLKPVLAASSLGLSAGCLASAVFVNVGFDDYWPGGVIRRDHTATVISAGEGLKKRLLVNGQGITELTSVTKLMAHAPLSFLDHRPESALVICMGMGTSFRSAMRWGIQVTVVELVPSVRAALPYYHADGEELLRDPNGHIVIDDGRRFLQRTADKFDLITLDPPPPVEAAGSSLLYSEGFYDAALPCLKPNGILQQWLPPAESSIAKAVYRSIKSRFPHVLVYHSIEDNGLHFFASRQRIEPPTPEEAVARMPAAAQADLTEWFENKDPVAVMRMFMAEATDIPLDAAEANIRITDDRPYNEYFVLRRGGWSWTPPDSASFRQPR